MGESSADRLFTKAISLTGQMSLIFLALCVSVAPTFASTGKVITNSYDSCQRFLLRPRLEDHLLSLPLVRQMTSDSCGSAALLSILAAKGIFYDEIFLNKILKPSTHPNQGVSPEKLKRVGRQFGFQGEVFENLTLDKLDELAKSGHAVIVAIQAWRDAQWAGGRWADDWQDGHYVVYLGSTQSPGQELVAYFMDPSLTGAYGYIPAMEFLERWHDFEELEDGTRRHYYQLGIAFQCDPKRGQFPTKDLTYIE